MHMLFTLIFITAANMHSIARASGVCGKPELADNTKPVLSYIGKTIGETIRIECAKGYVRKAGTSSLFRCTQQQNSNACWHSDLPLKCIPDPRNPPVATKPTSPHPQVTSLTTERTTTLPAVQLLCLEHLGHSLEDHTRDFLDLACLTPFQDGTLCTLYYHGLSERYKPANGPRADLGRQRRGVLVNNRSLFRSTPAAWSYCLSPLQMESLIPPRLSRSSPWNLSLHHGLTKRMRRQHRPLPREFW
ncbi:uncharacterized protein LOC113061357 isoform X6 [Carassius auratus]|uniref:Uncharacterized protein LOC113061357 isoform X6 n=1 Tax=Carassius auratus TaxID=7957 RepID=A0A6P6LNZ4_CARAU|nr:interleukin-15 receptor subunit alpha isoform X6 [Carassius auratus]